VNSPFRPIVIYVSILGIHAGIATAPQFTLSIVGTGIVLSTTVILTALYAPRRFSERAFRLLHWTAAAAARSGRSSFPRPGASARPTRAPGVTVRCSRAGRSSVARAAGAARHGLPGAAAPTPGDRDRPARQAPARPPSSPARRSEKRRRCQRSRLVRNSSLLPCDIATITSPSSRAARRLSLASIPSSPVTRSV
jgi:hypothetical protein